jgi:hypothetical protein
MGTILELSLSFSHNWAPEVTHPHSKTKLILTHSLRFAEQISRHYLVSLKNRSWNGNPLVDERTGARHADVRLGGLWNRHGLKRMNAACVSGGFNQN